MSMIDRLWAGWRANYLQTEDQPVMQTKESTLFETILDSSLPDEETYIVWRGELCYALLNAFPYTSGHVMVLPNRGVADLCDLTETEHRELFDGVRMAVSALRTAFAPHGVNVGINLGRGAGAGIPDHLHVHVVPRWKGDTNFMTAIANTRVLPETLASTWRRVIDAWPQARCDG